MTRTFEAVWATLGLDAQVERRAIAVGDTIRRAGSSTTSVDGPVSTLAAAPTLLAQGARSPASVTSSPTRDTHAFADGTCGVDVVMDTLPRLSVGGFDQPSGTMDAAGKPAERDIAVTGLLGEGGMGRVFLGYQRSLRREVALKTVFPAATAEARSAVLSEGFITGHLEHPNIIPVHELGLDSGGLPLLVMKRVIGFEWSTLLADPCHPAWSRMPAFAISRPDDRLAAHVEILMQVAQALAYAHGRGVIHRDLKPDNVMIGESGEVYLVDWGVARMLSADEVRGLVGTPAYLAPEMIDDELPVGPWTDVYLLGATLHAVLTGRPRHEGSELPEVLRAAYDSKPYAYGPAVPEELAALCNRSTARTIATRPSSALEFHRALATYVSHAGSLALADAANERLAELERVLNEPTPDDARAARVAVECRFGHLLALREWPDNPRAKLGLRAALLHGAWMEIARENAPAARAAFAELAALAPDDVAEDERVPLALVAAVEAVVKRQANAARAREELEQVHREQDFSISTRQRTMLLALIGVLILFYAAMFALRRRLYDAGSSTPALTVVGAITLVLAIGGVVLGRRWLLRNTVNRQFAAALVGTLGLLVLHRGLSVLWGGTVVETLRGDLFIGATATAMLAVHASRSWLMASGIMVLATILSTLYPSWTQVLFPAACILVFVSISYAWRHASS